MTLQPINKFSHRFSFLFLAALMLFGVCNFETISAEEKLLEKSKEQIDWKSIPLGKNFFAEGATAGDLNRDGKMDLVYGPFWFEGPNWEKKHLIYKPKPFDPHRYSDNFFSYVDDFNNDGWNDVLVLGFPGKEAFWYENPQNRERPWEKHLAIKSVDNESPTYWDLTGDGQREIVCSQNGVFGFATVDKKSLNPFSSGFSAITGKATGGKFTHGLGTGDINGDGQIDLLEKSGWWENPGQKSGSTVWKKHEFSFSKSGGSQMFATDVDGDGDQDVITALEAHGYGIAWFEQIKNEPGSKEKITFRPHLIVGATPAQSLYGVVFSQPHAVCLADIDGDGLQDIVTGKRYWAHGPHGDPEPNGDAVLYWFRCERYQDDQGKPAARFVPQLISRTQGIGVDVQVHDMNGDSLPDVVVGNKQGVFVHLQTRKKVSLAQWKKSQPMRRELTAKLDQESLADADGKLPNEAANAMTVPKGFRVDLIAGEPNLHQPIAFCFDDRGRIWVTEAHTYPQRAREGKGKDRIVVLEDVDGDGQYEKQTLFRDGLNLVSGLEVGFGGVWVGAAPYLMFIPDENDDLIPDGPEKILLDGWGYQDTHETLNSFNWGPDGWLYGCHGVFTHSKVGKPGTPEEKRTKINAGIWRYHPVKHQFEVFAYGTSNPWGIDFNDEGEAFLTSCVIPHAFHVVPGGRYHRQAGRHFNPHIYDSIRTIADHRHYAGSIADHAWWRGRNSPAKLNNTSEAGGGHAHCGALVYRGDNFPDSYRNTLLMCNIHGNRVNNDLLRREGATYIASHGPDFLYANDPWFRGISLKVAPDGAVYLIDWYDKNACHRHQPEIWDRTNGRMYRVAYGDYKQRAVNFGDAIDADLLQLLSHKNSYHVTMARKELQERYGARNENSSSKTDVSHQIKRLLFSDAEATVRLNYLWALHVIGGVDQATTLKLFSDNEPVIRAWAVRLAGDSGTISSASLQGVEKFAGEEKSPIVRRELASILQKIPANLRWNLADALISQTDSLYDKMIPYLLWFGIEPLVTLDTERALKLAEKTKISLVKNFILQRATASPKSIQILVNKLATTKNKLLERQILFNMQISLQKLGKVEMPADWKDVSSRLINNKDAKVRATVRAIAVKFGDQTVFPQIRQILTDSKNPIGERQQAINDLVAGKDQQIIPILIQILDEPAIRLDALRSLSSFESEEIPKAILSQIKAWTPQEQATAVATLCSRVGSANTLFDAINKKTIPRSYVTAVHIAQVQQLANKELLKKVEAVWGTIGQTPEEKLKQIASLKKELTAKVLSGADLPAGRLVYNKTCGQCHRLFGEGGKVGPDLTGSNRKKLDYLLENMVAPNALVGKDYQAVSIVTEDGRVVTGLIKEENDSAVILQTVQEIVTIDKSEIEERSLSTKSIMPEGQLKTLNKNQIRDLIAYLQADHQVPLPEAGRPVLNKQSGMVPGAIEGEKLKTVNVTDGKVQEQKIKGFTKDYWSRNNHLWWTGGKPGSVLNLEFTVKQAGEYEILGVLTKAKDCATIRIAVGNQAKEMEFDLYSPTMTTTGVISLGKRKLAAGKHQLKIKIVGKNSKASPAYLFGLDYLYLATSSKAAAKQ